MVVYSPAIPTAVDERTFGPVRAASWGTVEPTTGIGLLGLLRYRLSSCWAFSFPGVGYFGWPAILAIWAWSTHRMRVAYPQQLWPGPLHCHLEWVFSCAWARQAGQVLPGVCAIPYPILGCCRLHPELHIVL